LFHVTEHPRLNDLTLFFAYSVFCVFMLNRVFNALFRNRTSQQRFEKSRAFINDGGNLVEVVSGTNTLHLLVIDSSTGPLTESAPTAVNNSLTLSEDSGAASVNVLANDRSEPDLLEMLAVTAVTVVAVVAVVAAVAAVAALTTVASAAVAVVAGSALVEPAASAGEISVIQPVTSARAPMPAPPA
jgi:hypothetical protein